MSKPPAPSRDLLQRDLGYRFRNYHLCELALTHRSWANQHGQETDNERLEFLGDSILGVVISLWLYRHYSTWTEGQLTKAKSQLVSQTGLVPVGEALQLKSYVCVGQSQGLDPIPDSVIAGTMEALLGAVFVDGGYAAVSRVIRRLWNPYMQEVQQGRGATDYKSQLQEWGAQHVHALPRYTVVGEQGPAHARQYEVLVTLKDRISERARGRNKKEAEQRAAEAAWKQLHRRSTSTHRAPRRARRRSRRARRKPH